MSKYSVLSTWKSNDWYWTLLRPKYCASIGEIVSALHARSKQSARTPGTLYMKQNVPPDIQAAVTQNTGWMTLPLIRSGAGGRELATLLRRGVRFRVNL